MLAPNRGRERKLPNKDAKSYYIFCEGRRREYNYFLYFKEIDSKINIEPIQLGADEDNSPTGLYSKACELLMKSEHDPYPKYEILDIDEVWFVIDTDIWGSKIPELRRYCDQNHNWNVAQSNPCFEVWLYYHFFDTKPTFEGQEISKQWKSFVNDIVKGGFDHRKHPVNLRQANENSEKVYNQAEGIIELGCTEVFRLGTGIYRLTEDSLKQG
jgi:hypothetical protein